jgi:two-component system, chemotaxis family, sensor kinase CheA
MPTLSLDGKLPSRQRAPLAVVALLLVPTTIAACAAGSEFGLTGTTIDIVADAGSGERTETDGGGTPSSSRGTGSGGGSGTGSSGIAGGASDASSHDAASSDANGSDAASSAPDAADATARDSDDADDGAGVSCPITVTKNIYDTTYDGDITYLNIGTGNETDPIVTFSVPGGASIDTSVCTGASGLTNQIVPSGITSVSCNQNGTTVFYTFTGIMPTGSQIALYYTTNLASEAAAKAIGVTAASCP